MVACREFAATDYSRTAFEKFSAKVRILLAGHERVLQMIEASILKNPSVWDQMHEHVIARKKKNDHAA